MWNPSKRCKHEINIHQPKRNTYTQQQATLGQLGSRWRWAASLLHAHFCVPSIPNRHWKQIDWLSICPSSLIVPQFSYNRESMKLVQDRGVQLSVDKHICILLSLKNSAFPHTHQLLELCVHSRRGYVYLFLLVTKPDLFSTLSAEGTVDPLYAGLLEVKKLHSRALIKLPAVSWE